ncbi:MAG: LacI family DNA-binding transcriptional regulator [Phycisphaerae bacterium]|nr:LacI family DNA-binding transcriptional regulator [Phycisphaerae bacterium]
MTATLSQIAAAAKVSVSTASRALNSHPAISKETVERVRKVARKMRYQQRRSHRRIDATQLLAGRDIGVISLGMDRSLIALPAIASAINGAEAALSEAGARVQLAHVPDPTQMPSGLSGKDLDGVILAGALQGDAIARARGEMMDRLRALPTVWLVGRPLSCWGDAVVSDDYAVGAMAAETLISRGHRRLAFVNPKPDHLIFIRRQDGFVGAARRLDADVQLFCESPPEGWRLPLQPPLAVETVQVLVDRLLKRRQRATAIFAAADSVATLVYRALSVRDLRVGRDISVISGNNDYALIAGLHPRLATFDIHADRIGRMAVRQLAMRMADPTPRPDAELMLEATPIEGESVDTINT